jgi:hypothetical protein
MRRKRVGIRMIIDVLLIGLPIVVIAKMLGM